MLESAHPGGTSGEEPACQCRRRQRRRFNPCVDPCQEDPPEEEVHLTPVFLPGKFHGQRSLTGYSPRGCKELDTTEHTPSNQIIGVLESAHSGLFQPIVHFYRLPWWLRG